MPWMPQGEDLYKHVKKYKPTILTSPSREESSRIGKGVWVKRNMPGTSTCSAASKIMRNKDNYSKPVVAMANYANNFGCKK